MERTILAKEANNQSIRQPLISTGKKKYAEDTGTEIGKEG